MFGTLSDFITLQNFSNMYCLVNYQTLNFKPSKFYKFPKGHLISITIFFLALCQQNTEYFLKNLMKIICFKVMLNIRWDFAKLDHIVGTILHRHCQLSRQFPLKESFRGLDPRDVVSKTIRI